MATYNDKEVISEKDIGLTTNASPESGSDNIIIHEEREGLWTRMGVTPRSFTQRKATKHDHLLNQTMKPRHLHMIAIGRSIGAGPLVSSWDQEALLTVVYVHL
jgi:amino acid permease